MKDETVNDALLREFLLGKASDEARERIENLFLTDSQARERVLAVEQDLIEDYLEGNLITEDREKFVSRYAQTPEQQRKLRITKSIKDWALTEAASTRSIPVEVSSWRARLRFRRVWVIPVAVSAMIVIVVAAIWLNSRKDQRRLAVEQELAQLNAPASLREVPAGMFSTELSPVTVRGTGPQSQLNTHAESGIVELRLLWIQKERYSTYQVAIRRVGDRQSFAVKNLQAESDGKAIRLRLPTHILTRGTYQINLSGIAADGSLSPAEEYTFTVDSQPS